MIPAHRSKYFFSVLYTETEVLGFAPPPPPLPVLPLPPPTPVAPPAPLDPAPELLLALPLPDARQKVTGSPNLVLQAYRLPASQVAPEIECMQLWEQGHLLGQDIGHEVHRWKGEVDVDNSKMVAAAKWMEPVPYAWLPWSSPVSAFAAYSSRLMMIKYSSLVILPFLSFSSADFSTMEKSG
eukprot:CAMPEP_0119001556 /NCGR_PEP_ID=MMETSP1173-20130426/64640_1 /TAXON_ID=1034831 /ORGANISM="Rhizochromulina marina cf, Strain CCMP1243" /LENGTH=181 /DNA_ID=CAMNT_0006953061 /DNA_START=435 /DNA_END=978 /DNA_ORIENTATION=-